MADAFIIGRGMLEHSMLVVLHGSALLVICAKTMLPYNPQDSDLNEIYLESVALTHFWLIEKHFSEKKHFHGAKTQIFE